MRFTKRPETRELVILIFVLLGKKVALYVQLFGWPADVIAEIWVFKNKKSWFKRKCLLVRFRQLPRSNLSPFRYYGAKITLLV